MNVLSRQKVKDDPRASRDWTTIGTRILEAATIASAIHLEELTRVQAGTAQVSRSVGRDRDESEHNG